MIEEIQVGEQKIPIEVKPLTLIFKSGDFVDEIKYPNRIPIGIQDAIYHIERVKKLHKDLFYYLAMAMLTPCFPISMPSIHLLLIPMYQKSIHRAPVKSFYF